MSESVKIGGIGKNPAIEKINQYNASDIKKYAVNLMKEQLLNTDLSQDGKYKDVPIDFGKADWEG